MSKTVFNTPEFLELKKKWDEKLAEKGFEDIEYYDEAGKSGNLLNGFGAMDAVRFYNQDVHDYYYRANQHRRNISQRLADAKRLRNGSKVPTIPELKIWTLHAQGVPITRIKAATGVSILRINRYLKEEVKRMWDSDTRVDPDDIPLLHSKAFQIRQEFDDAQATPKGKVKKELNDE